MVTNLIKKLDNLFYLFLNQLNFQYADDEGLTFSCTNRDFLLIPDNINITIEVYYEFGRVRFSAYQSQGDAPFFNFVCGDSFSIAETNLIVFRDWVKSIPRNL